MRGTTSRESESDSWVHGTDKFSHSRPAGLRAVTVNAFENEGRRPEQTESEDGETRRTKVPTRRANDFSERNNNSKPLERILPFPPSRKHPQQPRVAIRGFERSQNEEHHVDDRVARPSHAARSCRALDGRHLHAHVHLLLPLHVQGEEQRWQGVREEGGRQAV